MGASVYEDPPFIIMEWMANGNVLDFIRDKPTANRVLLVNSSVFINMDSEVTYLSDSRSTRFLSDLPTSMPAIPYMET